MRAQGGSDPKKLFGRLKAEKVGSLPPDLGRFRRFIFSFRRSFPLSFPDDAVPQGEG